MFGLPTRARGTNPTTYAGLVSLMPPVRRVAPVLSGIPSSWMSQNVQDPHVLIDPKNANQLLLYFGGVSNSSSMGGVGRATAPITDPYTWTQYGGNPILAAGGAGAFDEAGVRVDCVVYNATADEFWMYYTGRNLGGTTDQIGLATSPGSDGITFTKYGSNPILSPVAPDTHVSNCGVLRDDATHWYMYYCHRTATDVLRSIKVATSSDGLAWTQPGTVVWGTAVGDYDATYKELVKIYKFSDKYALLTSCFDGITWSAGMASCDTPTGTFVKESDAVFRPGGIVGNFDAYQVACPMFWNSNNHWYLIYQGEGNVDEAGDYNQASWNLGMADF